MPRLQKTWILPTLYFRALEGPLKFGFLRVYACFCVFICVYACFTHLRVLLDIYVFTRHLRVLLDIYVFYSTFTCFTRHLRVLLDIYVFSRCFILILSMQRAAACAVVGLVASANLLFPFPYKATFFSPLLSLVY
ncbi:hypothetical protein BDR26DRAFT_859072 [Obelidium mucronatum]|nr:hypothetical protein BDR26DRAFT_859072 [Obelidium mucronatum]